MATVERGIERLAGENRSGWSSSARSETVVRVLGLQERLQAEVLRAIGEWDEAQAWLADGALTAPSWLAHRAPVSRQRAQQLVRAARLVSRRERVGKALASGDVSAAHVEVLAAATKGRARLLARDEDLLVDIAPTLSVDDFTAAMKHWRSAADDEMARDDAHLAFEERSFSLAPTLFGRVDLRGSLDADGGAIVAAALRLYDRPDAEPDAAEPGDGCPADGPRTIGQRAADALVQLCSEALHERERAGHHTPGVDGLIDLERLAGEHDRPVEHEVDSVAAVAGGDAGAAVVGRCELTGIGPVARSVLQRLACDAAVGRIVMRGKSEVLDVGRRTRVVPRALRHAIEVRDRHCAFPGCTAPLHWCDVHHLRHWSEGGGTDLDNCLLLCRRHHVLCHEGGWRLARAPDGSIAIARHGGPVGLGRRAPPVLAA